MQSRTGTAAAIIPAWATRASKAIRTPWCSAPLITLAVAHIRDHRKKGTRPEAEITTLKAALLDSNAELASRLVGQLGSRNGYAVHAACAIYPHDSVREMGLGEAPSREVRLAAPLLDVRLLWIPDEDLLTHPDRLNFEGKIRRGQHPTGFTRRG